MNLLKLIIKKINESQRGGAILEFSLVVPLLLSLSFAGFEFSRSLKILQVGSTLSREAANLAFRRCAIETGVALTSCLQTVADETVNFSRITLPGVSIILSVWKSGASASRASLVAATSSTAHNAADIIANNNLLCTAFIPDVVEPFAPFTRICKRNSTATDIQFRNISGASGSATAFSPAAILANHGTLIFAESYVEYEPIVGAIGNILNIQGQRYYDATVI